MHVHIRQTSNGYYIRVTKGLLDMTVVKRAVAKDPKELGEVVAEITEALKD